MLRRRFLRGIGAIGAAAAALGGRTLIGSLPRAHAGPLEDLRYLLTVPEIFAPLDDPPNHSPILVIGSGFGGAVSAYRLARAGYQVTLLERGSRWPTDAWRDIFANENLPDGRGYWFNQSPVAVNGYRQNVDSFGGVLEVKEYPNMRVYCGAGVGGGSLVYTGVALEPERRFFEQAFSGTGVSWAEMHDVYYPRARRELSVSPMPDLVYRGNPFTHSRSWDSQALAAGYRPALVDGNWNWDVVLGETLFQSRASAAAGQSNLGNSNGSKYTLDQNYLRFAEATGNATIYSGHRVSGIGRNSQGRFTVQVEKRAPNGTVLRSRELTCDALFLAAGAMGTSELLMSARERGTLPNLNQEIGLGWGSNGEALAFRSFSQGGGFPQGAPCRSAILDETASQLPVRLENWYTSGSIADLGGIASLGIAMDPNRGRFRYEASTGTVQLEFSAAAAQPAREAARRVNARIATAARLNTGIPFLAPDVLEPFTTSPLGGAVLGRACDSFGRVRGYSKLYVMDGAAIPGSTGAANPALTIVALAERNIERVLVEDNL